jgi:hypothetical protein
MITTLLVTVAIAAGPSLEVRVDGEGYLRFARDGRAVYAKSASLTVASGKLASDSGAVVLPSIAVPATAKSLDIDLQGNVVAVTAAGRATVGRLVLAIFARTAVLSPEGDLLVCPERPRLVNPGDGEYGVIRIGGKAPATTEATPAKPGPLRTTPRVSPEKPPKPVVSGEIRIDVAAASEISGDTFTLGEVAKIVADPATAASVAAISMGNSPYGGVHTPVGSARILSRLKAAGIDTAKCKVNIPAGAWMARKSLQVTHKQFADAAIAYATTQTTAGTSFVTKDNGPDYLAPVGELELKVEQYAPNATGAAVTVAVFVDGKRCNSRTVRLEMTGVDGGPLIRVSSGTRVKILFRSNDAVVQVQGKTSRAAAIGQAVEVTTDQRTKHTGILTGPDTVEVKL